jgi:hypothetical protein
VAAKNEFMALCFASNPEILCHTGEEIKFFPLRAIMNEDHDLVYNQN